MRRNKFYRFSFNRFRINKFKIIALMLGIIIMASIIMFFPHFFRNTYIVTISSKQVKRKDNKNVYLIYTQTENGDARVFEDTDSLLEFKFNSEDIYGALRINRTYEVKTYGFRIPLTAAYQNIVKVKGIR
ncbi:DUF1523 family protein [Clostridium pasteurianum]|uniref:DUF1523 domain-containing protein n=1 Tax=Clostridium pasteurianum BC1 TaxID=86416 RepID=R4K0C9_CLOPA|nr:DUF1523 family protein [Clostridium pasteurianum]AGK96527.1 Protein of unknown function (DUF1523) [Clostridium pasteurianum BC1]